MSEYFVPGRSAMYDCAACRLHKNSQILVKKPCELVEALDSEKIFSSGDKIVNQIDKVPFLTELTFQWNRLTRWQVLVHQGVGYCLCGMPQAHSRGL